MSDFPPGSAEAGFAAKQYGYGAPQPYGGAQAYSQPQPYSHGQPQPQPQFYQVNPASAQYGQTQPGAPVPPGYYATAAPPSYT
jgi:hypothetical protein